MGLSSCILLVFAVIPTLLFFSPAHGAQTGTVCLMPDGASACSSSPTSLSESLGGSLRVSVFIQGSGGLSGFDITLLAERGILNPVGIDLTGTVLMGTPFVLTECLGGALIQGNSCSTTDLASTIHLTAVSAIGSPATITPTTGLLFTAIYNVTSIGSTSLGFMTGCRSSVNGTSTCVAITNGSATPLPEHVQTANFNNGEIPSFSISASPDSLSIPVTLFGVSTITVASLDGFSGVVSLDAAGSESPGPLACFPPVCLPFNVNLTPGGTGDSNLTVFSGLGLANKLYFVTVTGVSGNLSRSVIIPVTLTPLPPDFFVSQPSTLLLKRHSSISESISLFSLRGFSGTVELSIVAPLSRRGPTITSNASNVTLSSGGSADIVLTITAPPNAVLATYSLEAICTSGSLSHTVLFDVTITK